MLNTYTINIFILFKNKYIHNGFIDNTNTV